MNESMPVDLQALLTKLHFISQIERGKKPCMSDMSFVKTDSYLVGPIIRWWKGESRKTLVPDIEKIVDEAIIKLTTYKDNEKYVSLIINLLASDRVSIESLITTYREDPKMISNIKVILTNIDLQLDQYRHLIKGRSSEKGKNSPVTNMESKYEQRKRRKHRPKMDISESSEVL
jgi:hypothetical protein